MKATGYIAAAVFVVSVAAAALLLLAEVDALFWPGSEADATYPAWLFLLLTLASFVLYAAAGTPIIRAVRAIRDSLHDAEPDNQSLTPGQLAVLMTSTVLTVSVWTAIAFPHSQLGLRYGIDTSTVGLVVLGTFGLGARRLRSDSAGVRHVD